jgi:hypothetical protein
MRIDIYHGSETAVRQPRFGVGRAYNDFGLGFYCTESREYAAEWAVSSGRNGFVSAYTLDTSGLRVINLCGPQYTAMHWLCILLNFREFDVAAPLSQQAREYINRNYAVDYQGCDCISGYRADDVCFTFAREFLSGGISYQSMDRQLRGSSANREFVLKSNRAFDRIMYSGHETALVSVCYPVRSARELSALRSMKASAGRNDLFITDMIREEVKPYDPRLR